MGKIKKNRQRKQNAKAQPYPVPAVDDDGDMTMGGPTPDVKIDMVDISTDQPDEIITSNREVYQKHRREFKEMKAQIAILKKQRKKTKKKTLAGKEGKKKISAQIRNLLADLRKKHEAELNLLGLKPPTKEEYEALGDDMQDDI
eukprot:GHVL01011041.1.p2 GENE.GHVL01011041.1~~GHVL01011041.1.p2  ORF type:complete len:144 (-),score=39.57 GHVL01011041.1:675-1106(-)